MSLDDVRADYRGIRQFAIPWLPADPDLRVATDPLEHFRFEAQHPEHYWLELFPSPAGERAIFHGAGHLVEHVAALAREAITHNGRGAVEIREEYCALFGIPRDRQMEAVTQYPDLDEWIADAFAHAWGWPTRLELGAGSTEPPATLSPASTAVQALFRTLNVPHAETSPAAVTPAAAPAAPAAPPSPAAASVAMRGIDYANARGVFFLSAVKQAGFDFVVRYLDGGRVPGKQLSRDERDRILGAGLGMFLVFETTGGAPNLGLPGGADYFTRQQGRADAQDAITAANALDYPDGAPVFYAVDQGLGPDEVVEYFNGADEIHSSPLNVSRYVAGAYADYAICQAAFSVPWPGVPWRWQTSAWSGGQLADGAQLYQSQNHVLVAGAYCDIDALAGGVALPTWTQAPPPDPLWSRPDSSPLTLGDLREYARRLQKQIDDTLVKKTA